MQALYPKPIIKKKRKKHPKSILQAKELRCCYLCMKEGDYSTKSILHEHHIFGGPNRTLSEQYGLKVYLCPEHHEFAPYAVHSDPKGKNNRYLQEQGQKAFEKKYPDLSFREIFGKNYKGE